MFFFGQGAGWMWGTGRCVDVVLGGHYKLLGRLLQTLGRCWCLVYGAAVMVVQTPGCMARRAVPGGNGTNIQQFRSKTQVMARTLVFLSAWSDSMMLARTVTSLWQQL